MPCWSSPDHRLGQMKPKPHEPVCSGHASLRHRRYNCIQLIGQAALKIRMLRLILATHTTDAMYSSVLQHSSNKCIQLRKSKLRGFDAHRP